MPPSQFTAEEAVVADDFRASVGKVFQDIYGDRWDEDLWVRTTAAFEARHPPHLVQPCLRKMAGWESWDECREHFRKGPPVFMREGWVSPLLGRQVDLRLLDDGSLEWIQGSSQGWQDAKVLILEFWATWCKPCIKMFPHISDIAAANPGRVKVLGINVENIFNNATDVDIRAFVANQSAMNYPVAVDVTGRALEDLVTPSGRLAIPTALLVTPADRTVHFVGNPAKMDEKLNALLK